MGRKRVTIAGSLLPKISRRLRVLGGLLLELPTWRERRRVLMLRRIVGQARAAHLSVFHPRCLNQRPVAVRDGTSDISSLEEALFFRRFMPEEPLRDVSVIVDLGGNTGIVSAYLAEAFADARIICVEPDAENAELARRNTFPWRSRVRVVEAAIWSHDGEVQLSGTSQDAYQVGDGVNPRRVRAIRMTTLMAENGVPTVDFLKINIEGAETPLFTDGPSEWLDHVRALKMELHKESDVESIRESLAVRGFWSKIESRYGYDMLWARRDAIGVRRDLAKLA